MTAKGLLFVTMEPERGMEDELNAWYDTEHLADRLAVPGFESARRWVCMSGGPSYLATYDLAHPGVLTSDAYRAVSGERSTPWTRRVTARVRLHRRACVQVAPGEAGTVGGARLDVLRLRDVDPAEAHGVAAGMAATYDGRPETIQWRLFRVQAGDGVDEDGAAADHLGLAELRAPVTGALDPSAFGAAGDRIEMIATYRPY